MAGPRGSWEIARADAIHNYAYKQLFCLFNAISDWELEGRTSNGLTRGLKGNWLEVWRWWNDKHGKYLQILLRFRNSL